MNYQSQTIGTQKSGPGNEESDEEMDYESDEEMDYQSEMSDDGDETSGNDDEEDEEYNEAIGEWTKRIYDLRLPLYRVPIRPKYEVELYNPEGRFILPPYSNLEDPRRRDV